MAEFIYTIAHADSIEKLIKEVNDKLKVGWKLHGSVTSDGTEPAYYMQAMVMNIATEVVKDET